MVKFNFYLIFILAMLGASYFLDLLAAKLNLRSLCPDLPAEFEGWYDAGTYRKSQLYTIENTRFGIVADTVNLALLIGFILIGGFNIVDIFARQFGWGEIGSGLIFTAVLMFGSMILGLPFSAYRTFVIEEKYGFNRTSVKTFITDLLKGIALTIVIGAPLFAAVIWFFKTTGELAWLYVWVLITLFHLLMIYIGPTLIMPLFNKFTPLEEGSLKNTIEEYASRQNFKRKGIFTIDGSKRSTKSNAFFSGFGKSRRIALYDTLVEKHSDEEILAILAHEIGHFKLRHVPARLVISVAETGLLLFILSFFINNRNLFDAFGMQHLSIYGSFVFFGFLYAPISTLLGVMSKLLERRHEYDADRFAAKTTNDPDSFTSALKKVSISNMSNLTPHPLKVFLDYDHPPVLERIRSVIRFSNKNTMRDDATGLQEF